MEGKNTADHKIMPESESAYFKENPTAPVRILVSTATHLVPGDGYFERTEFMQNLISKYHWNHDFEDCDRFEVYDATFSYNNRKCYFLLDHGQSPDGNDNIVPILWYTWTGTLLKLNREVLPSRIKKSLEGFPFTPPKPVPRTEPRIISAIQRREDIITKLECDMGLSFPDRDLLKNPEHLAWLESKLLKEDRLREVLKVEMARKMRPLLPGDKQTTQLEKERPSDCTEMWDCECSFCSS